MLAQGPGRLPQSAVNDDDARGRRGAVLEPEAIAAGRRQHLETTSSTPKQPITVAEADKSHHSRATFAQQFAPQQRQQLAERGGLRFGEPIGDPLREAFCDLDRLGSRIGATGASTMLTPASRKRSG